MELHFHDCTVTIYVSDEKTQPLETLETIGDIGGNGFDPIMDGNQLRSAKTRLRVKEAKRLADIGKKRPEIAKALGVSEASVYTYLRNYETTKLRNYDSQS